MRRSAGKGSMSKADDIHGSSQVAEEAATWFARLQGEAATGDDWLAFERWLEASSAHARAYEALEGLWVDLEHAPLARELGGRPLLAAHRRVPARAAVRKPGRRVWLGVGAAVAASLAVAVGLGLWSTPSAPPAQTYRDRRRPDAADRARRRHPYPAERLVEDRRNPWA